MLSEIDYLKKINWRKRSARLIVAALFIIVFAFSFQYAGNFRDAFSFWRSVVNSSPHSALAHNNLGAVYSEQNNFKAAQIELEQELKLNPGFYQAWLALGDVYDQLGNAAGAKSSRQNANKLYGGNY